MSKAGVMQSKGSQAAVTEWLARRRAFARDALPLAGAVLLATALLFAPGPARSTTYKWIDDKGVVHYTDTMPPEAVNKGSIELNKQGIPVKKTEPALTPEQRRLREVEDARLREIAKAQEEINRRDRALLSSYTTESEIDLTKQRALASVESVVQSARAYGDQLTQRKAEIDAQKASYGSRPVPPALDRELEGISTELARQNDLIALKKREADALVARYDADKLRWRELVASKSTLLPVGSQGDGADARTATPVPAN
jgi:Domain of unknown function (DUF4124)